MSEETRHAQEEFEAAVELVRRKQIRPALLRLLSCLKLSAEHRDAMASASRLFTLLGDESLAQRLNKLAHEPDDPQFLYDLGYDLVSKGRPDVGATFLRKCLQIVPEQHLVRYELGFAELRSRRFDEAVQTLIPILDDDAVSPHEEVEAGLLLTEAAIYACRPKRAREGLESVCQLALDDAQRIRADSLHQCLSRWASVNLDQPLDLRDWHYIQHGALLLAVIDTQQHEGARGGRLLDARPGYGFVAAILEMTASALEEIQLIPDNVIAVTKGAEPLAATLATRLGVTFVKSEEPRQEGLLVARSIPPDAHELVEHTTQCPLFSFGLDWTRNQIVVPEITGMMSQTLLLPWETPREVRHSEDGSLELTPEPGVEDVEAAAEDLHRAMEAVDIRDEVEELILDLQRKRGHLVLGHAERHPQRRCFCATSPIETSPVIFP